MSRLAYVAILILATLSPFVLRVPAAGLGHLLLRALHPGMSTGVLVDGIRNVVLFAGWGLLWVLSARPELAGRSAAIPGAVLSGAALSVTLELIQLFVPTRTTSILDVLTNTIGSLLGATVAVGLVVVARAHRGRRSILGVPAFPLAASYASALAFEAAFPLMRRRMPGTYGGPLTRLAWSLRHIDPGSIFRLPILDAALFLPAGYLAVAALLEADLAPRAAVLWTAVGAVVLAVAGEASHLVLAQSIVLGAMLVHTVAPTIGAWLAARQLPSLADRWPASRRAAFFLLGYVALLAVWVWRPFDLQVTPSAIARSLSWRRLIPMASLHARRHLDGVSEVMVAFFLFAPVGTVLAEWPLRRAGALSGVLPALLLALVLEGGQVFLASHFVDITDALVTFAGAAVAWAVLREAGYPIRGTLLEGEKTGVAGAGPRGGG